jgi:plasmid stability protein
MFLGQKPTKKWTDTDRSEVDVKLSDFAKRILDLEALRVHYDRSKRSMDGEFDVILLKSLKRGSEPIDEVIAIDSRRKDAIQACKKEIYDAIKKHSDSELQLAALAEVVDEFLNERNKPNSVSKQKRKQLKEVKNG